jgi:hypothetical membrane protein
MSIAQRIGPRAGLLGSVALGLTAVVTALVYTGTAGEGFSPVNHWVSELGEMSVSRLAIVFNAGLFVSGICFAIFMSALAVERRSRLAWLYGPIGIVAGIGGAFVGVFPMDSNGPHIPAALTFFVLGWMCVGLASMDIWRRPQARFPRWLSGLGALAVLAFLAFLSQYIPYLTYTGTRPPDRPPFQLVVALEWVVLVGIIGWVFVASISWWRHRHGDRA